MVRRTPFVRCLATPAFVRVFRAVLVAGALIAAFASLARAQTWTPCASVVARVNVAPAYEPQWLGHYRYTLTITWDVGRHDPSHLDFLLGMPECLCICDERVVRFDALAGTSTGVDAAVVPCTVNYRGAYVCNGDPSIRNQIAGAAVKFEPIEAGCSTNEVGSGTFVFYSPFPPGAYERRENAIAIKHGNATCYGRLEGALPACDCSVPAEAKTWGRLKVHYR